MAPIYKNSNTILAPTYKSPIIFRQLLTKAQYYLGNYLQKLNIILATTYKNSILSWQVFTKAQYYFGNYLQKLNIILATIYKNSNTTRSPITILGNILSKAQLLVWQNFTNTQKPKYYPWQYFIKSPNNILAKFYKNPNTILGNILQNINDPKLLLFGQIIIS